VVKFADKGPATRATVLIDRQRATDEIAQQNKRCISFKVAAGWGGRIAEDQN